MKHNINSIGSMRSVIVFTVLTLHFACANGQTGKKIEMDIQGIKDTVLYLVHYYGNSNSIADTAFREKSGKYIFRGDKKLPGGVYVLVDEQKSKPYLELLIDRDQHFSVKTDTADMYGNLKFTNSPLNDAFREYSTFVTTARKEMEVLKKEEDALRSDSLKDHSKRLKELELELKKIDDKVKKHQQEVADQNPGSMLAVLMNLQWDPQHPYDLENGTREDSLAAYYYTRQHYWDKVDLSDERNIRTPIFHEKLKTYLTALVVQHPDSVIMEGEKIIAQTETAPELYKFVVWYIVNMSERSNIMGMEKAFVYFAKNYYLAGKTWWASEAVLKKMAERVRVLERILIGSIAPELQMWDTNKVTTSLRSIKADYTIVVFWDYECGHCSKMLPKLLDYYHEMRDQDVKVFAVCTKTDWDKWTKYIREKNLDWINVNGGYSVNRYDTLYDIMSTPIIFLLDRDKKIIAKKIELDQLKEIISLEIERNKEGVIRKD